MSKKKFILIGISLLAIIAALVGFSIFKSKSAVPALTAEDVVVVEKDAIEKTVSVTGVVNPVKETTLSTTLTGPVQEIFVKSGERVGEQQLLARINVDNLQTQLSQQQSEQATAELNSQQSIAKTQRELAQLRDSLDKGLQGDINSAESTLREAQIALDIAQRKENILREDYNLQRHPNIIAQEQAVNAARSGVLEALPEIGDNPARLARSLDELNVAEENYSATLRAFDETLADAADATAKAFRGKADAATALETTKLGIIHQLEGGQQAIADAQALSALSAEKAASSNRQLVQDIQKSEVLAPHAGVVTDLRAREGVPAAEGLMVIADDSSLIIRSRIKEADISSIREGDDVRFTTTSTGSTIFTGTVKFVSPVAQEELPTKEGQKKTDSSFPIEIEVTGNREGIRIGSNAKVRIITERSAEGLVVPNAALIGEGDTAKIVVVTGEGNTRHIEVREVTVEERGTTKARISGEITEGENILRNGEKYLGRAGKDVRFA